MWIWRIQIQRIISFIAKFLLYKPKQKHKKICHQSPLNQSIILNQNSNKKRSLMSIWFKMVLKVEQMFQKKEDGESKEQHHKSKENKIIKKLNKYCLIEMNFKVIIVGGGIGGLTLARALQLANINYLVLEQQPKYINKGQGIGLWGPALMSLRALGLQNTLLQKGKMMTCAGYKQYKKPNSFIVKPSQNYNRLTSCLCLRRQHLHNQLVQSIPSQKLLMDKRVDTCQQSDQKVLVKLENGQQYQGDLCVGADGIWSRISNANKVYNGYYYYQGISKYKKIGTAYEMWGQRKRFGIVQMKIPQVFWFAVTQQNLQQNIYNTKTQANPQIKLLKDHFQQFGQECIDVVDQTIDCNVIKTPIYSIQKGIKWIDRRKVLLGDAAHAMAPNLAQGACLAIEDALNLAQKIHRHITQNLPLDSLLQMYEEQRKKRSDIVQTLVPLVHKIGTLQGIPAKIRNIMFWDFEFIKTRIFDRTHQFALGNRYTVPDFGIGLYARLIGYQHYKSLPTFLKRFHTYKSKSLSGNCTLSFPNFSIFSYLLPMPYSKKDIKCQLSFIVQAQNNIQHWNRTFSSQNYYGVFNTKQSIQGQLLKQQGRWWGILLQLQNITNGYKIKSKQFYLKILGFRLYTPKKLIPIISATCIGNINSYNYSISLSLPFTNTTLLTYQGIINSIEQN